MDFLLEGLIQGAGLLWRWEPEVLSAVSATLRSSLLAMAATLVLGLPLGYLLAARDFPGRQAARTVFEIMLALPTVVIGLLVFAFLSRRGPLGSLDLLFSVPGMALGLGILALPMVVALTAAAVEGQDRRLALTLQTLGAGPGQAARTILWEARLQILAAALTAFGRVVSEVGIAMMVGGNIKWQTRTITTAIALETGKGEFAQGLALGLVLLAIVTAINLVLAWLKRRYGT